MYWPRIPQRHHNTHADPHGDPTTKLSNVPHIVLFSTPSWAGLQCPFPIIVFMNATYSCRSLGSHCSFLLRCCMAYDLLSGSNRWPCFNNDSICFIPDTNLLRNVASFMDHASSLKWLGRSSVFPRFSHLLKLIAIILETSTSDSCFTSSLLRSLTYTWETRYAWPASTSTVAMRTLWLTPTGSSRSTSGSSKPTIPQPRSVLWVKGISPESATTSRGVRALVQLYPMSSPTSASYTLGISSAMGWRYGHFLAVSGPCMCALSTGIRCLVYGGSRAIVVCWPKTFIIRPWRQWLWMTSSLADKVDNRSRTLALLTPSSSLVLSRIKVASDSKILQKPRGDIRSLWKPWDGWWQKERQAPEWGWRNPA